MIIFLKMNHGSLYHPNHAISHRLTTDFSLRSSEPSQPRGGRHKGAAVEMCVSPLGSRRRPVANAAAPGADENGTPFPYTDHRKRSFSTGFIRFLSLQAAVIESLFCQWFCMVLGMRDRTCGKIHGNTMLWVICRPPTVYPPHDKEKAVRPCVRDHP